MSETTEKKKIDTKAEKVSEAKKDTKKEKEKTKVGGNMEMTKEDVITYIENMSVLELSEMVKELQEKFGVTAMAPASAAVAAPEAKTETEAEEKTEFDVILSSVGDKKIHVIKEVRTITALSLKDAKALVDEAPKPVKEKVSKEEAEKIKAQLEGSGATVEIK